MNDSQVSRRLRAAVAAAVIPLPGEVSEQSDREDDAISTAAEPSTASENTLPTPVRPAAPSIPPLTKPIVALDVGSLRLEPTTPTAAPPATSVSPRPADRAPEPRPAPARRAMPPRASLEPKRILAGAIAAIAVLAVASWLISRDSAPNPTATRVHVSPGPPTPAPQPPRFSAPTSQESAPSTPAAPQSKVSEPAILEIPRRDESGTRRPSPQPLEISPAVGSLRIRSVSGARVFVDDVEYTPLGATGEVTITDVPVGAHNIRLTVGDQEITLPAMVIAGRETPLEAPFTPPPATVAALPEPPAAIVPPPEKPDTSSAAPRARTQTFEFAQWPWTQYVQIGPNELRYERRTSAGRVDSDSVVASCSDIEGVRPGAFGGGMSIRLKNGAKVDISRASKQQISQLQEALERACSQR